MSARQGFSTDEARDIGEQIGIDWATAPFDVEQLRSGLAVELEHGLHDLLTNVTDDDPRQWEGVMHAAAVSAARTISGAA